LPMFAGGFPSGMISHIIDTNFSASPSLPHAARYELDAAHRFQGPPPFHPATRSPAATPPSPYSNALSSKNSHDEDTKPTGMRISRMYTCALHHRASAFSCSNQTEPHPRASVLTPRSNAIRSGCQAYQAFYTLASSRANTRDWRLHHKLDDA
jgi:hypothetical protein